MKKIWFDEVNRLVYRVNRKTVDICVEACYTVP